MSRAATEYRVLVHRMFDGAIAPAAVRERVLSEVQRQGRFEFEAGAPTPHDGAEALTAARTQGERQP